MTPRVHANLGRLTYMGGSDAQVRKTTSTRNNVTPGEPHVSKLLEKFKVNFAPNSKTLKLTLAVDCLEYHTPSGCWRRTVHHGTSCMSHSEAALVFHSRRALREGSYFSWYKDIYVQPMVSASLRNAAELATGQQPCEAAALSFHWTALISATSMSSWPCTYAYDRLPCSKPYPTTLRI
jgi:hypothetical protein